MPNLVEIGSVVPEEKLKCLKPTNDDGEKVIAIGHLSDSGEPKNDNNWSSSFKEEVQIVKVNVNARRTNARRQVT